MTVKELHDIVNEFKSDFKKFISNDFQHLEEKVDRNTWFIGIGMGILGTLQVILHFIK